MDEQLFSATLNLMPEPKIRKGLKDVWNAYMTRGATFTAFDIPNCPTTAKEVPAAVITWDEAITIHRKQIAKKNRNYYYDAFICFYMDDYKFDGPHGVWHDSRRTLEVLMHFSGVITPDFSTYQDFPEAIKIYATYRMRLIGYWWGQNGIPVINNVRWGTEESWAYCFEGIPHNSIVAIGTVGGSPRQLNHRDCFEKGLYHMVEKLHPHTIITYGSADYECFYRLSQSGINVISYPSKKAEAYVRRDKHE